MQRMSKAALGDHFVARAKELAATGEYASVREIEQRLWSEGCANPSSLLNPGWIRDELCDLMADAERRMKRS